MTTRACAGHDKYASRGSDHVIHVDCDRELSPLLHGNTYRCGRCAQRQTTYSTLRATRKWNEKTRARA